MHEIIPSKVLGSYESGRDRDSHKPTLKRGTIGIRATIQPPVTLNPQAVERFVSGGSSMEAPILLGQSEAGTVIFGQLKDPDHTTAIDSKAHVLAASTQAFLGMMGIESIINRSEMH